MATLTITTRGPMAVNVDIVGVTIREPNITQMADGLIALELGGTEVSAIFIGRPDIVAALLREGLDELDPLL